ncbi:short chain dehydrogenase [Lasiosphaeria ovina]|uniref:Short chain dehydrogenase n=1 Tax=Lasiosphaeria ovina TaxID=92902 RepID=A0AAE0TXR0_9PEZI|nr:short chain dehydrogenase [Lasiosphaeria ovina]
MAPSTYRKLQDKHILFIGGSGGIGAAVAEASLEAGAHATITSSSQTRVDGVVASLAAAYPGSSVRGAVGDLSNPATIEDVLESIFQAAKAAQGGRPIDHVVFTAADALTLGPLDTTTPAAIAAAAHMRLVAPVVVAKVAARHLARSHRSSIVITTGSAAERPAKGWSVVAYFAGGLASLARALAVDLAPIRVNAVQPGPVDTALWGAHRDAVVAQQEAKVLTGRVAKVEDVAEAYIWLLKDENATGSVAATDGGELLV